MANQSDKPRILLVKAFMEAHDRGLRYVARILRDAGMEVILTRFELPEEIVKIAIQEDVDAIGISESAGGYEYFTKITIEGLKEKGLDDIPVILGGIIPEQVHEKLLKSGVAMVFGPGSADEAIIEGVKQAVKKRKRMNP
jgi:methylmalonyl-CoA mutase C-terminal domain/subunit